MGYNKNMDNDDYIRINEEGLAEVNPTASSDAQMAFIDAYRAAQGENTAQIGEQAHALGSDLEAQYGGLHGPSEYWKSRYQTPQTESRVAGLRSAAQLSALNNLMQNDLANWKNRYSNAYKAAQKRALSGSGGGGGDDGGGDGGGDGTDPDYLITDDDLQRVNIGEQDLTLPTTDESPASSAARQLNAANYGASGELPTKTGMPVYLEQNGLRTAGRLYNTKSGVQGLDTGNMSYTGAGADAYISDVIRNGGKLYNAAGKDISPIWRLIY